MKVRNIATAGMVSDTSLYNIDGACVVGGSSPIAVGTAVRASEAQPIDGHKVVIASGIVAYDPEAAGITGPLGVVVKSHYETPDGTARAQESVNVMTAGRIWMRAEDGVTAAEATFGRPVFINATGKAAANGAGAFNSGWTYAGGYVQSGANADGVILVEVQVKQK